MKTGTISSDVYKAFGRHTAAGRTLYNLMGSKDVYVAPKPNNDTMRRVNPIEQAKIKKQNEIEAKKKKTYVNDVGIPQRTFKRDPKLELDWRLSGARRKHKSQIEKEVKRDQPVSLGPTRPVKSRSLVISEAQDLIASKGKSDEELKRDSRAAPLKNRKKTKSKLEELEELFSRVEEEIAERRNFLAEMEMIGKADAYKANIAREIKMRTAELKRIDRLISLEEKLI